MKLKSILCILFAIVFTLSCNNEDLDDGLLSQSVDLIAKDSDLFNLLEDATEDDSDLTCIAFIYPFRVLIFNENNVEIASQLVDGDGAFFMLLDSLEDGNSISVSFPITSVLEDGSTFEVSNQEELQEAIAACKGIIQAQVVNTSNEIVKQCVWEVAIPDDVVFSTYIDAVFTSNPDGSITFFHRGISYQGTWILFFIEDELHFNVNLNNQDQVGEDWNFDWKVNSITPSVITLTNYNDVTFIFNRECDAANYCTTLAFQECEFQDNPGFANFDLASYSDCIITIAAPQPIIDPITGELTPSIDWSVTYFESEQDAQQNTNPINTTLPYVNIEVNQVLFARIVNPENQEFVITSLILEAVFCE